MTLAEIFGRYLHDPTVDSARADLVGALADAGGENTEAAALLGAFDRLGPHWTQLSAHTLAPEMSPLLGRRCWVNSMPPAEAFGGELWFDTVEVAMAILVPRPAREVEAFSADEALYMTPNVSWLSVRPARVWQLLGFYAAVGYELHRPLGPESHHAMGPSGYEADRYATFFGKSLATWESWWAAAAAFDQPALDALWPLCTPELGGYAQEDRLVAMNRCRALSPDPDPTAAFPTEERHLVEEAQWLPGVRLRTEVSCQLGLFPPEEATASTGPIVARSRELGA